MQRIAAWVLAAGLASLAVAAMASEPSEPREPAPPVPSVSEIVAKNLAARPPKLAESDSKSPGK